MQPNTHEVEPSYEVTSSVQACGWIASCHEGCTDKCIPNEQPYHRELEALLEMRSVTALKCAVVAGLVKQFGMFGSARRMLRSESSSQVCHNSEARSSHHCSYAPCTFQSLRFLVVFVEAVRIEWRSPAGESSRSHRGEEAFTQYCSFHGCRYHARTCGRGLSATC